MQQCRLLFPSILFLGCWCCCQVQAWIVSPTGQRLSQRLTGGCLTMTYQDDDDDNQKDEPLFFDDFADFSQAAESLSSLSLSSSFATTLQSRLNQLQQDEARVQQQIQQNWQRGNWMVRGISLDRSNAVVDDLSLEDDEDNVEAAQPSSSEGGRRLYMGQKKQQQQQQQETQFSANNDEAVDKIVQAMTQRSKDAPIDICKCVVQQTDEDDSTIVWLGRTDGSLVAMAWSDDEPWARFATKVVPRSMPHGQFTIQPSLVKEASIRMLPTEGEEEALTQQNGGFDIVAQVLQVPEAAPISHMVPTGDNIVLTSTETGKGDIQAWLIPQSSDGSAFLIPTQTWTGVHTQPLVALHDYYPGQSTSIVCSISADASLALWSVAGGDLTATLQLLETGTLSSAFLTDDHVYLGTSDGQILIYTWTQILEQATASPATSQPPPPLLMVPPVGRVSVSKDGTAVTAITTITTKDEKLFLAAGTAKGTVKQWQLFAQQDTLQAWPKLETQRLPNKAHVFPHTTAGVAIVDVQYLQDGDILLTATPDSIVCWNTATARKWHSLEGFEHLTSVAIVPGTAAFCTNGMQNTMCIHDYSQLSEDDDDEFDVSQYLEFDPEEDNM